MTKYNYAEAYKRMRYTNDEGKEVFIWNSRDGLTPYSVTVGNQSFRHQSWAKDQRIRHYCPPLGDLIFAGPPELPNLLTVDCGLCDQFVAEVPAEIEVAGEKPPAWEYREAPWNISLSNKLGGEGWELVFVHTKMEDRYEDPAYGNSEWEVSVKYAVYKRSL